MTHSKSLQRHTQYCAIRCSDVRMTVNVKSLRMWRALVEYSHLNPAVAVAAATIASEPQTSRNTQRHGRNLTQIACRSLCGNHRRTC